LTRRQRAKRFAALVLRTDQHPASSIAVDQTAIEELTLLGAQTTCRLRRNLSSSQKLEDSSCRSLSPSQIHAGFVSGQLSVIGHSSFVLAPPLRDLGDLCVKAFMPYKMKQNAAPFCRRTSAIRSGFPGRVARGKRQYASNVAENGAPPGAVKTQTLAAQRLTIGVDKSAKTKRQKPRAPDPFVRTADRTDDKMEPRSAVGLLATGGGRWATLRSA
jgi:hypothetical protein